MELKILLALSTDTNDYQRAQQSAARQSARSLNVDLQIIHADNDPIMQSQQLLAVIQNKGGKPHAMLVQPAGNTELPQVAQAAVSAGIGWAILNRNPAYIMDLRKISTAPVFAVTSNQREIGRIQGLQVANLLPEGGRILYLQGPSGTSAAQERTLGLNDTKPANISVLLLKCPHWTKDAGYKAVERWFELSTSKRENVKMIVGQNDVLALGALQAFRDNAARHAIEGLSGLRCIGVDGIPEEGQTKVRQGELTATIIVPPNAGMALELMVSAIRAGNQPFEITVTEPKSYPPLRSLEPCMAAPTFR